MYSFVVLADYSGSAVLLSGSHYFGVDLSFEKNPPSPKPETAKQLHQPRHRMAKAVSEFT